MHFRRLNKRFYSSHLKKARDSQTRGPSPTYRVPRERLGGPLEGDGVLGGPLGEAAVLLGPDGFPLQEICKRQPLCPRPPAHPRGLQGLRGPVGRGELAPRTLGTRRKPERGNQGRGERSGERAGPTGRGWVLNQPGKVTAVLWGSVSLRQALR